MLVQRTGKEIVIRLSAAVDTEHLQDLLDYARYKELTAGFSTPQLEVDKLAKSINRKWWLRNRNKLAK